MSAFYRKNNHATERLDARDIFLDKPKYWVESVVPGALVQSVRVSMAASALALDAPSFHMGAIAKLAEQHISAKKGKERQGRRVAKLRA